MTIQQCSLGVANIKMHPHAADKYLALIKDIQKLKIDARVFGESRAIIARRLLPISTGVDELDGIYGEISKFTDISGDAWLNLKTNLKADESDLKAISIPDHIKPNYAGFVFLFFPKRHLLFFETKDATKTLSPTSVERFLKSVFSNRKIKEKYGQIDITIIPDADKVDEILSIHTLKNLTIEVDRPNPGDDFSEEERELLKELDDQNIARQITVVTAVKGKSIQPNKEIETLAKIAAQNGYVRGRGVTASGQKVDDSTKQHPMIGHDQYDNKRTSLIPALNALAHKMMDRIVRRPRA